MFVGSMVTGNINHPDDYRKTNIEVTGVVIKQSGEQCRVHLLWLDKKPVDRIILMHASHLRILS